MIKIVPDANIIISSLLGHGGPKRWIINLALEKKIILYGSATTYKEFLDVIDREQFKKYLDKQIYTTDKLDFDYKSFINIVDTDGVYDGEIITVDPDDDEYFRVANVSGANIIVSEDKHILDVPRYDNIRSIKAKKFIDSYVKTIAKSTPPF